MDIQQAKNIRLSDYLQLLGFTPQSVKGDSLWYLSPLREEKDPSFKVSQSKNVWYDFGLGKGGTIIDFALLYYNTRDVTEILKKIGRLEKEVKPVSFSSHPQTPFSGLVVTKIKPLENKALIEYLKQRGIDPTIAGKYLQEIYFKQNGKHFFALAFPNRAGGYELRNKYFKGCIAPKDITIIGHAGENCNVFEGFIDFLSFLSLKETIHPDIPYVDKEDYLILNSVLNLSKALKHLQSYPLITSYLDNDAAGERTFTQLKKYFPVLTDGSAFYNSYKDINDYLIHLKSGRVKEKNISSKLPESPDRKPGYKRRFR